MLFPQRRMLLLKPFQNGFHDRFPEETRFVFDPVAVAIDPKRPHLPVIEH